MELPDHPYGWFTGINGTITARGPVGLDCGELHRPRPGQRRADPVHGAMVEAGKDRFSVFGDFFYSKLGFSAEKSKQVNPVAGLKLSAKAEAALTPR